MQRLGQWLGQGFLFLVTSLSALAVLFLFYFIAKDAVPFFVGKAGSTGRTCASSSRARAGIPPAVPRGSGR